MPVQVQAERWCRFLTGGGNDDDQSPCGDVALAECAVCGVAFCENHALICPECLSLCCPACDHDCSCTPVHANAA